MSKEKGQRNRDLFLGWVAEMKTKDNPNWSDYCHGGTLSPKKIADELGFDSSAFKQARNLLLHNMLQDLKAELSTNGFYHERKLNLKKDEEKAFEPSEFAEGIKDSAQVRDLKRINRRLQDENAKLTAEVARLSEFKDVLVEMGLWK